MNEKPLYACFTLDYELDYGGRARACDTMENVKGHRALRELLDRFEAPLSAFVQTSILSEYEKALPVLQSLATEVHSHSHTHASEGFDSRYELETSLGVLEKTFRQDQYGYRAPFGKLYDGDIDLIQSLGYAFDSSVFPSFRPGKFNHLRASIEPTRWSNGLLELPFGVLPQVRLILGISYMKLFGPWLYRGLMPFTGLPRVLMFYGHMHDYFPTPAVEGFSPLLRRAFARNAERPLEITASFLSLLKARGYRFVTVNQLASALASEGI